MKNISADHPNGLRLGCVIMASGMGKRFGRNKLMADFCGRPLILRPLQATEGLFARRVVVTRHEEIAALCRELQVPAVLHSFPFRSDTVRLGLEAVGDVDGCLFCPGDLPLLSRETVASLLLCFQSRRDLIWRTGFDNSPGAPVIFPQWSFPELLHLPEGKGGGYVVKQHPELVKIMNVMDHHELMDIDTPEDLASLENYLQYK